MIIQTGNMHRINQPNIVRMYGNEILWVRTPNDLLNWISLTETSSQFSVDTMYIR